MKKHLIFALILLLELPALAQVASARSRHGGHPNGNATMTVVAPRHQSFWLYVDDILQNEEPVRSICIRNLWDDSFYIRVEINNQMQNSVGQFVDLRQAQTLNIVQSKSFYGLEYSQAHVRPELTMDLITNPSHIGQETPDIVSPMPPAPLQPTCMKPQDYDQAYQLIANETFDSSRLTVAQQVISSNPMSASQILGICKLFSFENNKLEFAKYAYPYCTDKNKYYLLNEAFSYESSKRDLSDYINGL